MNRFCIVKENCQYKYDENVSCQFMGNGCKITTGNPISVEDTEKFHLILTCPAVADLTKDGRGPLEELLECVGFDTKLPYEQHSYDDDRQVEFLQEQEWK